ncbi:MAG: acyltransferase [Ruminococcaceae bacterium]|nr:acyltransferase [Oscillospiraceae bacterium]
MTQYGDGMMDNIKTRIEVNHAFDVAKLFLSIMVIAIHMNPFGVEPALRVAQSANFWIHQWFCRIAVPLFFVMSGFLLYSKSNFKNFDTTYTKKYFKHILKLYLLWSLIYFPLALIQILRDSNGISHGILQYISRFIFAGSYRHLWYLNAILPSICLISFMLRKGITPKRIVLISFAFYVLGLLGDGYYGLTAPLIKIPLAEKIISTYYNVCGTTQNGMFFGLFFLSLGMYFSQVKINISAKKALLLFIFSMALLACEVFIITKFKIAKDYGIMLCTVPAAGSCFLFLNSLRLKDRKIYNRMREASSFIYYSHIWIGWIVSNTLSLINDNLKNTPVYFLLTVIFSIVASAMVSVLKKRFSWIKIFM